MKIPDLGKMYGPLPLGAWVVVIGVGGGIAYWNYKANGTETPVEVEDGSSPPGVGDGSVGGWQPTSPPVDTGIPESAVTTNDQWGVRAINWLIANNYPAGLADSAIRKYLAGIPRSVTESALVTVALGKWGSPPTPLPPDESEPPPVITDPPPSGGTPAKAPVLQNPPPSVGKVSVNLKWSATPGALYYIVMQGASANAHANRQTPGPVTSMMIYSLKPNNVYTFSVSARLVNGSLVKSNVITVRTHQ